MITDIHQQLDDALQAWMERSHHECSHHEFDCSAQNEGLYCCLDTHHRNYPNMIEFVGKQLTTSPPLRDPLSVKDATQESSAEDVDRQGSTEGVAPVDPGVIAAVSSFVDRVMQNEAIPADAAVLNLEMLALLRHQLALVQIAVTKSDRADALKEIETAWSYAAMLKVDR